MSSLFDRIITSRGLDDDTKDLFLSPDYSKLHDPFLLADMDKAVERIIIARKLQEQIVIYGDYDIDGLTATALMLDGLTSFGFKSVDKYIPNRFTEGYGLTVESIEIIASSGAKLIITVDCGSLSEKEIIRANELGVDVIVTDHHNAADIQPPAIAVINPKRKDDSYPFSDLAGVGVAFKLIQALQMRLGSLPKGQEKWLLDLVALGTVCDVVPLLDENRIFVYWGLKVLSKTKRLGLKALLDISKVNVDSLNTRSLGFSLGPRMNAAGRLETAMHSLELLTTDNRDEAFEKSEYLDNLNVERRAIQARILKEATVQADYYENDSVLVVSDPDWNHGIVGIVAAKLLERYKKPTFVLQEMGEKAKGSARSFGDFSAAESIEVSKDIITKGGGHKLAAGVVLPTENIAKFRDRVNKFYDSLGLTDQHQLLLPRADVIADLSEVDIETVIMVNQLEPFGNGNPQPILKSEHLLVKGVRKMGDHGQHLKIELWSGSSKMSFLAFNAPEYFFVDIGQSINVWYHPEINEWGNSTSVEGKLLHLEISKNV